MSTSAETAAPEVPGDAHSLLGGLLSYLVPGLGQIYHGRVGKGVLFLVCLYGMFFYGWYLGSGSNVYLPPSKTGDKTIVVKRVADSLLLRLPFCCQFWIGAAAWPSIWQYNELPVPSANVSPFLHNLQRTPPEGGTLDGWVGKNLNDLQADGDKTWDLGLVYTMVAGILNILVIYDAAAGPAFAKGAGTDTGKPKEPAAAEVAPA